MKLSSYLLKAVATCCMLLPLVNTAYAWTEKWPINVPITATNAVSEFLKAHFGKVGEIAARQLDQLLNDPKMQVKLSAAAVSQLNSLYNDYLARRAQGEQAAQEYAAKEFIKLIEADIQFQTKTLPSGPLGLTTSYSPKYAATRLIWNRQVTRNACQKSVCICPGGSQVPNMFYSCPSSNGFYTTPNCSTSTDLIDEEAEYKIYRNSTLLATFAGIRSGAAGSSLGGSFNLGPVSVSLSATLPPTALSTPGQAQPFYDLDPQNFSVGTRTTYTVRATSQGCSAPYKPGYYYNNQMTGTSVNESYLTTDSDGDGIPNSTSKFNYYSGKIVASSGIRLTMPDDTWMGNCAGYMVSATVASATPGSTVTFYSSRDQEVTVPLNGNTAAVPLESVSGCASVGQNQTGIIAVYNPSANTALATRSRSESGWHWAAWD